MDTQAPRSALAALADLGIDADQLRARSLIRHEEAAALEIAEVGSDGREYLLQPDAAHAWRQMKAAAAQDGVTMFLGSAFRSIARQTEIIQKHLASGRRIDDILGSVAAPGYSEHHTGRAVDVVSDDVPDIVEAFETTAAFAWLTEHAKTHGFVMSYPKGNPQGYVYEPWHWCFHPDLVKTPTGQTG